MESLQNAAWHEAGHVVLFERLGIGVRRVRLGGAWDSDHAGDTYPAILPVRDPAVLKMFLHGVLGGPLASGRMIRWEDGELRHRSEDTGDAQAAAAIAGKLRLTEPEWWKTVLLTKTLLGRDDVIEAMERVQRDLLIHGDLEGDDLKATLEAASVGGPRA